MDLVDFGNIDPSQPAGYLIAFFIPLLDAFFPVVPSETVVITLGVLASRSFDVRIVPLIVLIAVGAFLGDNISYWLGRIFGTRITDRLVRGEKGKKTLDWAHKTLDTYGIRLLIVARFIPGGRTAVTLIAGSTEYSYRRFLTGTAIAAVIWTLYSFGIGLIGGRTFENNHLAAFALAFGVAAAVVIITEVVRRVLARRKKTAPSEPAAEPARPTSSK